MRFLAALTLGLIAMSTTKAEPPKEGDPAPDVALKATQVKKVLPDSKADTLSLKDFKGKKNVVLFYFPKALTKGCTIESCGFRDLMAEFEKADTVVIGFSADTIELQEKFTTTEMLNFPLLADTDKKLMAALGVKGRATWVVGKDGKVAKIYPTVKVADHPKEVLTFVQGLKK